MIDFESGDELELIAETAKSFASDHLHPKLREHEAARAVGAPVADAFAEIGLAALELPESLGGAGLGAQARAVVGEELGAGDAGAALALDPLGPAIYALAEMGGEDALREFALPLLEERGARALLVREEDARLEVSQGRISGLVPWVPADRVDLLVVARGDEAFVVREGLGEGVAIENVRGAGLRAAGASGLRLDGADVAAHWQDARAAGRALARARLYVASLLLGVLRQAADFSREYSLEREAFGKPIAHHQGLAFLIVDMRAAVDGARLVLQEAAWRVDAERPCETAAAQAFAEVIDAAALVGPNGVQILGGHGFMQDYPVEKYMREARTLGLWLGGLDAAREDAGQALCDAGAPVSLLHAEMR